MKSLHLVIVLSAVFASFCSSVVQSRDPSVYPGSTWQQRQPEDVGLDSEKLDRFAERVGGDGCVVCDGYLVKSWGEVTRHKDWASAAKPVLGSLLMLAVQEGRIASVDARVSESGWQLVSKDAPMTFRHLANMVSGYALGEAPGAAWGYNDYAIQLYAKSLEKAFGQTLDEAFRTRMGTLQFEDGEFFGSRNGTRVTASSRDFARLGWLWLNRGNWNGQQILDGRIIDSCFQVGVPSSTPMAATQEHNDYLKIDTYGGGTNQTPHGPGIYGFNFWFNSKLPSGERVWPSLPADAYQANGLWNRDTLTIIPSWNMIIASRGARPGKFEPGRTDSDYNGSLTLVSDALTESRRKTNTEIALKSIDLSGFGSGIHHWRNIRDENRFIQVEKLQFSYSALQVHRIVENIRLFQRSNGGWPKDYDMTAVLSSGQRSKVSATRDRDDTSYDNGNIHSQVEYLAKAYSLYRDPSWRESCERGLDFIFQSQYENGGFPQRYPNPSGFYAHITFNDGVMMGVLNVLRDAANGVQHFAWLDEKRRQQARDSVERGISCILKCQNRVKGVRSGWCQQHDEKTFEPRSARTFELASNCPQETTEIVTFLMQQPTPASEIIESVDAAVAWLRKSQLSGIRVERIKSTRESFLRHDTDSDVVVVQDRKAGPIWARHYELDTDRPIFAGRDGVKRYNLSEIERERRTGSAWYGGWPIALVQREYDQWRKP